jgi:hypothetical protein
LDACRYICFAASWDGCAPRPKTISGTPSPTRTLFEILPMALLLHPAILGKDNRWADGREHRQNSTAQ